MKIAVTGGTGYAGFLISLLTARKHRVTVIESDESFCEQLSAAYDVNVIQGDPCQEFILKEAGIRNYDVIMALGEADADNFEVCQMGKKSLSVKRAVCLVHNPRNVEVFKELGMDHVVNVPVILADIIE